MPIWGLIAIVGGLALIAYQLWHILTELRSTRRTVLTDVRVDTERAAVLLQVIENTLQGLRRDTRLRAMDLELVQQVVRALKDEPQ